MKMNDLRLFKNSCIARHRSSSTLIYLNLKVGIGIIGFHEMRNTFDAQLIKEES